MKWDNVSLLVQEISGGKISGKDALYSLKPYIKSSMSQEQSYGLTVLDALVVNCPVEIIPSLTSKQWQERIFKIASEKQSKPITRCALQLIVNWAEFYKGTDFGMIYEALCKQIESKGVYLPSPRLPKLDDLDEKENMQMGHYESGNSSQSAMATFQRGMDFTKLADETTQADQLANDDVQQFSEYSDRSGQSYAEQPLTPDNHETYQPVEQQQEPQKREAGGSCSAIEHRASNLEQRVKVVKSDIHKLLACMVAWTRELQALRSGMGDQKSELDSKNQAWIAAEQCEAWSEKIQGPDGLLSKDFPQEEMSIILDANDKLNFALQKWNMLVSIGPPDDSETMNVKQQQNNELEVIESEIMQELGHLGQSIGSGGALGEIEGSDSLREQNNALKAKLIAAEAKIKAMEQGMGKLQTDLDGIGDLEGMQAAVAQVALLKQDLRKESILRKRADKKVREMNGNIRVVARVRPPIVPGITGCGQPKVVAEVSDDFTIQVSTDSKKKLGFDDMITTVRNYEYDYCFGPDATQDQVYAETEDLVKSAFEGYNVCIFCYGQTGGGKTYTIMGDENNPGIIYRAIDSIYNRRTSQTTVKIRTYMLELYKDSFLDLLGAHAQAKVYCKADQDGIVKVEGAKVKMASNPSTLKRIFEEGNNNRKTASTRMNIHSSRSHLVFTILLEVGNVATGEKIESKITFVDLAGSERVYKSGSIDVADRMEEAKAINKSLAALGDVVSALTSGETFVPYRNHKITELMRDSIGGSAKTLMVVNISPNESDIPETKSSLDYAQRVKQVKNDVAKTNGDIGAEVKRNRRLAAEIESLQYELERARADARSRDVPAVCQNCGLAVL